MKQKFLLTLGVTLCLSFFLPAGAQAGLLEFFFPSLKKEEYNPYETLRAPFAEDAETAEKVEKIELNRGLPEDAIPLNQPHLNSTDIASWLITAVSEALTFQSQDYKQDLSKTAPYFSESGQKQYIGFLQENSIIKVLESRKFKVSSFVQEQPLLLNEGAVGGRYRWLFEVPVMISYMDSRAENYEQNEPVNQRVSVTVQLGRVEAADDDAPTLHIERWAAKVEKLSKK